MEQTPTQETLFPSTNARNQTSLAQYQQEHHYANPIPALYLFFPNHPSASTMSRSDDASSPTGSANKKPHAPLTAEQKKQNHILSGK
jgi:hypothetical protein